MIVIKTKHAIDKMRSGGKKLSKIVNTVVKSVQVGMTTAYIDQLIELEMKKEFVVPACKGYAGYRHASCISVNDTVIHGIPSEKLVLQDGDLVSIDLVGRYDGYCTDMARSFIVGKRNDKSVLLQKMIDVATEGLNKAIAVVKNGIELKVVSGVIQKEIEQAGFGVVRTYAGHGIGKNIHEEPEIPNYVDGKESVILRSGMTIAIEPMITEKNWKVLLDADGWTVKTVDGGYGAHVEDTILVTDDGCEVLTRNFD